MKNNNSKNKSIGICLGATTLTLVEIENKDGKIIVNRVIRKEHEGDPKNIFTQYVNEYDFSDTYAGITGRKFRKILNFPSIIEPEAVEYAYQHINKNKPDYDAIVTVGGETFVVYQIDTKGKIKRITTGNKCASGTGEFFQQQIGRMNISIDEAVKLAKTSQKPYTLSGRCSVFCKSDCTHALNKGESIANVTAGLSEMIAQKVEELLSKTDAKKVMVVGGVTQNTVIIDFLRAKFDTVTIPEESVYFEALGAALWALNTKQDNIPAKNEYYKPHTSSFKFMKPLREYENMVEFKQMPFGKAANGDECLLGLDVGSTTTKAVLFRLNDEKILCSVYLRTNGDPITASRNCYRELNKKLNGIKVNIAGLGVTGSGRYISALHADTDNIINEIIAHARATAHFDSAADTIFEIGGQDAKYTFLTNSIASDYAMNEACSAGTGSFLEESAHEQLGIKMEDIAEIALKADNPPDFSDQCAAFIASDINTAFQEGVSKEDIVAGLVYSICLNYVNRVKGSRQVGKKVFMQGGVCYNRAIPVAMAALVGKNIIVPPEPGLMGAYGVALELKNMLNIGLSQKQVYDLTALANREVSYGTPFICRGSTEKCDRKCEVSIINIGDKKFPFGGACNKYYNSKHHLKVDIDKLNHVEKRQEMLFKEFHNAPKKYSDLAPVVGINISFQSNTLFPMFFTFFNELGCKVIISEEVHTKVIDKGMTSFCLSAQVALGLFEDLLRKKPNYIFMPQIMEMHIPSHQNEYRKEYQSTCMFVQGEAFYQKATFLRNHSDKMPKLLAPALNFMRGFDAEEKTFSKLAVELGFTEQKGKEAYQKAYQKQIEFFSAMKEEGNRILKDLADNPDKTAIVLFGRPYNAFDDKANKGIPFKFASRNVEIIPYDFLMYEAEENYKNTYWEMGQRIMKAARIVKRHPQLFGCYLTNFLCALDSILVPHFRDMMETKPSLTLEVDTHTADAGVNTRIEAFMDIIKNYLKVKDKIIVPKNDFVEAKTEFDQFGKAFFIDSAGQRYSFYDKRVKVLVPSMGDLFNEAGAAALRCHGWNGVALPPCDREALDLARSVTTGKECLPIINIIGEVLKYLKYRKNHDEKLVIFLVSCGGTCRVGQYQTLMKDVIEKHKIKDAAIFTLANDSGYSGLGVKFKMAVVKGIYASDVFDDIRSVIKALAVDKKQGLSILYEEYRNLMKALEGKSDTTFYKQLKKSADRLAAIKLNKPLSKAKFIGLVGEIFVRRDHFSLMSIPEQLAENEFVMLDAPVMEWVRYADFIQKIKGFEAKTNFVGKIENALSGIIMEYHEKKIKNILVNTGLYSYELIDIKTYMKHSKHVVPYTLIGEPGLSSGVGLHNIIDKYCGVINIGPFGCMNSRMTEAVATPEFTMEGKERASKEAGENKDYSYFKEKVDVLPFLSIESDGNPFSQILETRIETFMLQSDRLHKEMMQQRKESRQTEE